MGGTKGSTTQLEGAEGERVFVRPVGVQWTGARDWSVWVTGNLTDTRTTLTEKKLELTET